MPRPSSHGDGGGRDADVIRRGGTSILAEDVDQALLALTAAIASRDQPAITRSAVVANRVLTNTACPTASDAGAPSLQQWVDVLESLTTAALPTALDYLRVLYAEAGAWTPADRTCAVALVNLVFFTLVLLRQTHRNIGAAQRRARSRARQHRRQQLQPLPHRADEAAAAAAAAAATDLNCADVLRSRLDVLRDAQQSVASRYLCFIAWNAATQLRAVSEQQSIVIRGVPLLSQLPHVPLYLREQDCWIWLWLVVLINARVRPCFADSEARPSSPTATALSIATGVAAAAAATVIGAASTPSSSQSRVYGTSSMFYSTRGPLERHADRSGAATASPLPPPSRSAASSARHADACSSVGEAPAVEAGSTGAAGQTPTAAPRTATTAALLQLCAHDGGDLYARSVLGVLFAASELFVKQWVAKTPLLGDLLRDWARRTVQGPRHDDGATTARLQAFFEVLSADSVAELVNIVVAVDDVVVHLAPLFFASARPLLQLHQMLEVLVPLELCLLLLHKLHPGPRRAAAAAAASPRNLSSGGTDSDDEERDIEDDDALEDKWCAAAAGDADEMRSPGAPSLWLAGRPRHGGTGTSPPLLRYCSAVSQLLGHVAELLLEPRTQRTDGFGAVQFPQSLCLAMLRSTMMFAAAETVLHDDAWSAARRGSSSGISGAGGGGGGGGGAASLRLRWRWWSVWTNTAHYVCVTSGGGGGGETDAAVAGHRYARDVSFVQSLAIALEDVHALLSLVTSTAPADTVATVRLPRIIFHRIRVFFVRLHEEHLTAIKLHVVSPFSALGDGAFNAFAELLDRYEAVTLADGSTQRPASADAGRGGGAHGDAAVPAAAASTEAAAAVPPAHRSLWLLAVAYLRLAAVESATSGSVGNTSSAEEGRHRHRGGTRSSSSNLGRSLAHTFVYASSSVSLACLRDRSYESSDDWVQRQPRQRHRGGAADCFRCHRGELQSNEDDARERLLLASTRLLAAALHAASRSPARDPASQMDPSNSSFPSPHPHYTARASLPPTESQPLTYATAFTRYVCMLDGISSPSLLYLLRAVRDELRRCCRAVGRSGGGGGVGGPYPSLATSATSGVVGALGEQDAHDARLFQLESALYSV
ncbi:hypothetical protein NESM_000589200 [Novymonas esmeraldas]|uniref:Uncharacterized protein n=1 Tax=Novymonas esmeraldas TaxID=1808958 RepID=A0AAW0ES16_9TRYP